MLCFDLEPRFFKFQPSFAKPNTAFPFFLVSSSLLPRNLRSDAQVFSQAQGLRTPFSRLDARRNQVVPSGGQLSVIVRLRVGDEHHRVAVQRLINRPVFVALASKFKKRSIRLLIPNVFSESSGRQAIV